MAGGKFLWIVSAAGRILSCCTTAACAAAGDTFTGSFMRRFCSLRLTAILAAASTLFFLVVAPARGQIQPATRPDATASGVTMGNTARHPSSDQHLCLNYKPDGTVTNAEHLRRFGRSVFSLQTIAGPAFVTSFSQWATSHKGYGSDPDAWGYHFGINLARNVTGKFLAHYAAPAIFHQDDAYQPLGSGHSTGARIGHILHHIIVTDSADHTHHVFNASAIPASAVNTGLQNLYAPHVLRNVGDNFETFGLNMAGFTAGDVYREYRCAIRKLIPGHHHDNSPASASP
jgi:hypothetical protein